MAGIGGILLLTGFILVITYFVLKEFWPSRFKTLVHKIPGPPCIPFFGNAHLIKRHPREFFDQVNDWCKKYWPVCNVMLGDSPHVCLCDAKSIEKNKKSSLSSHGGFSEFFEQLMGWCKEYRPFMKTYLGFEAWCWVFDAEGVEAILSSSKHIEKSRDYEPLHPWLGTGLLTSTGKKWHSRRRLLTPTFHFSILNDFIDVFNEQTEIFVNKLKGAADGKTINIFPYITLCALDIICDAAMGITMNAQAESESEYVKAVYRLGLLVQERQKQPWLWNDFIYFNLPPGWESKKLIKLLHGVTEKVIRERTATLKQQHEEHRVKEKHGEAIQYELIGSRKRLAFLDMLLHASDGGKTLSFDDIREEVDTFMFEGHDTTAAAMAWVTHLIASHPDVQTKLQREMYDIFGDSDRKPTMNDLKNMKYLDCVIKEGLRLFPSVPMFARKINEDCEIHGYTIPAGSSALVVTYMLHRDEKYFPDPEKFDPDRFLPENTANRHAYAYVPFSAGLRNCIGQKFAILEEKTIISGLVRNFTLTTRQSREELYPHGELILRPESGIFVELQHRE